LSPSPELCRWLVGEAMSVKVHISALSGSRWEIEAQPDWNVRKVKDKFSLAADIPVADIRLISGMFDLSDDAHVSSFSGQHEVELTFIRRTADQSAWLKKVQAKGSSLGEAPDQIRNDYEIVLAAVRQDAASLWFAGRELCTASTFIQEVATAMSWHGAFELAQQGASLSQLLENVRKPVDVKLALILAAHANSPDFAVMALSAAAVQKAGEQHTRTEPLSQPTPLKRSSQANDPSGLHGEPFGGMNQFSSAEVERKKLQWLLHLRGRIQSSEHRGL